MVKISDILDFSSIVNVSVWKVVKSGWKYGWFRIYDDVNQTTESCN